MRIISDIEAKKLWKAFDKADEGDFDDWNNLCEELGKKYIDDPDCLEYYMDRYGDKITPEEIDDFIHFVVTEKPVNNDYDDGEEEPLEAWGTDWRYQVVGPDAMNLMTSDDFDSAEAAKEWRNKNAPHGRIARANRGGSEIIQESTMENDERWAVYEEYGDNSGYLTEDGELSDDTSDAAIYDSYEDAISELGGIQDLIDRDPDDAEACVSIEQDWDVVEKWNLYKGKAPNKVADYRKTGKYVAYEIFNYGESRGYLTADGELGSREEAEVYPTLEDAKAEIPGMKDIADTSMVPICVKIIDASENEVVYKEEYDPEEAGVEFYTVYEETNEDSGYLDDNGELVSSSEAMKYDSYSDAVSELGGIQDLLDRDPDDEAYARICISRNGTTIETWELEKDKEPRKLSK